MNLINHNREVWNKYVTKKVRWTIPVSKEEIENAKHGNWNIVLTPMKPVPHQWFPDLKGLKMMVIRQDEISQ